MDPSSGPFDLLASGGTATACYACARGLGLESTTWNLVVVALVVILGLTLQVVAPILRRWAWSWLTTRATRRRKAIGKTPPPPPSGL